MASSSGVLRSGGTSIVATAHDGNEAVSSERRARRIISFVVSALEIACTTTQAPSSETPRCRRRRIINKDPSRLTSRQRVAVAAAFLAMGASILAAMLLVVKPVVAAVEVVHPSAGHFVGEILVLQGHVALFEQPILLTHQLFQPILHHHFLQRLSHSEFLTSSYRCFRINFS